MGILQISTPSGVMTLYISSITLFISGICSKVSVDTMSDAEFEDAGMSVAEANTNLYFV